ncbi:zinc ribbon domain-containing protein [Nocardia tengchongensis]|uniref:zinc ribbon domain-containing protein n=1 Tax=Nocardia tengchongensis TaxID=2055889 RepID=UPI00368D0D62
MTSIIADAQVVSVSEADPGGGDRVQVTRKFPVVVVPNRAKDAALRAMAVETSRLRQAVWSKMSSTSYDHLSGYDAKKLLRQSTLGPHQFAIQSRVWASTVDVTLAEIRAWKAARLKPVKRAIFARTDNNAERKRLFGLLKAGKYRSDRWLSRRVRRALGRQRPVPSPRISIAFDNGSYDVSRDAQGRVWLAAMSTVPGKRIRLCLGRLPQRLTPQGSLTVRLARGRWEVLTAFEEAAVTVAPALKLVAKNTGTRTITAPDPSFVHPHPGRIAGIDTGVTECFTDSEGRRYGDGLWHRIARASDIGTAKGKRRNKLRAIHDRHLDTAARLHELGKRREARRHVNKARCIATQNLGTIKQNRIRDRHRAQIRDVAFQSAHQLFSLMHFVVAEDLTRMRGKSLGGKRLSRILSSWQRSTLAEALVCVANRRGSSVAFVNPAYTSQQIHACGHLGSRIGKSVHCNVDGCPQRGVVYDTETNAALNILSRAGDPEITLAMRPAAVRSVLERRSATEENCPSKSLVAEHARKSARRRRSTASESPPEQAPELPNQKGTVWP